MKKIHLTEYDIFFQHDFGRLKEALAPLSLQDTKVMVVFDSNTAEFYKDDFMNLIKGYGLKPFSFVFQAGEENKTLSTVENLYIRLIEERFERKDVLIAFGGGVTGDLTGFAASTYLRGIRFIQIPTSLLAMADSSIGGKTGVDFLAYKNMVGAFYQPSLVYINLGLLNSLPDREYFSGMAEIIKVAYIKDAKLLLQLKEKREEIIKRDYYELLPILFRACEIKKEVVEADFKESGERALLNFGHTLGHAIEKLSHFKLLHGECVSLGMLMAMRLSLIKSFLSERAYEEMEEVLFGYKLPVKLSNELSIKSDEVLSASKLDKKMEGGSIKFILLREVGAAFIDKTVSDEELLNCMKGILNDDEE